MYRWITLKQNFKKITRFSFARFCLVGGLLFLLDAALLYLLIYGFKFAPTIARVISASCSITVSWVLHRSYTFGPSINRPLFEYKRYIFGSLLSFIINLSSYIILIESWTIFWQYPILAVILATALSMNFSYLFMKKIVFLKK